MSSEETRGIRAMFVDLTEPERQRFIKQSVCQIPGYTGHCPTIRFRYGKTFGADTKAIIEDFRDISPICKDSNYRHDDSNSSMVTRPIAKSKDIELDPLINLSNRISRRPYVLGYTGYIPGLHFRYGSSFSTLADRSRVDFATRLADEESRRAKERLEFINTKPHLASIRGRDQVTETLQHYSRFNRIPGLKVTSELPPIAGYTGHIPGIKGSEASLGERYYSAAQSGLTQLQQKKNSRQHLDMAKEAVQDAIAYSHVH